MNSALRSFLIFAGAAMMALAPAGQCTESKSVKESSKSKLEKAYFAAGCFWKTQYVFSHVPGVIRTKVGYMGGNTTAPSYKEVCTDKTGHAETVQVEFDPNKVTFRKLLQVFWTNHDPTTLNRQGPDVGTQYRSAIFCTTPEQKQQALAYKEELDRSHRYPGDIVTVIEDAKTFNDAEDYHQNYFAKHGMSCH